MFLGNPVQSFIGSKKEEKVKWSVCLDMVVDLRVLSSIVEKLFKKHLRTLRGLYSV